MDGKFYFLIFSFFILIVTILILFKPNITGNIIKDSKNPEKVIENLYEAIEVAEEKGDYECCIKPACTMCYLGHWKFEKGTCYCDDAIAEGRDKDVCPECKSGIEEGLCSSNKVEDCEVDIRISGEFDDGE